MLQKGKKIEAYNKMGMVFGYLMAFYKILVLTVLFSMLDERIHNKHLKNRKLI